MSSYAIISDVHANREALQAVLNEIYSDHIDTIYFLGDSVGYGPDPNECTELLREKADIFIAGNHDWGAVGLTDTSFFNQYAKEAIEWTQDILTHDNRNYMRGIPLTAVIEQYNLFLVHASPEEPDKWFYLVSEFDAYPAFHSFKEKICAVGHSHTPFIMERLRSGEIKMHYAKSTIKIQSRYIVNAGSVGQPRDGNPEGAYVLIRENQIAIKRVPYDIVLTQQKMRKAGLPSFLIDRLAIGR